MFSNEKKNIDIHFRIKDCYYCPRLVDTFMGTLRKTKFNVEYKYEVYISKVKENG